MKNQRKLMIHNNNSGPRLAGVGSKGLTFLCAALVLGGCGKPPARPPEKALVRTAVAKAGDNVGAGGEASYLALVKFDQETDLSFKVGGILVSIGPAPGTNHGALAPWPAPWPATTQLSSVDPSSTTMTSRSW